MTFTTYRQFDWKVRRVTRLAEELVGALLLGPGGLYVVKVRRG